jgi:hypothetical protein
MPRKYSPWWLIGLLLFMLTGCVAPSPLGSTPVAGNLPPPPATTPTTQPEPTITPVGDQPPAEGEATLAQPFSLSLSQQTQVQDTSLQITFAAVTTDSRCPVAADGTAMTCVWAGEGVIEIQVQTGSEPPTTISLSTLGTPDHVSNATVGEYTLELVELTPQPTTTQPQPPQEEYQATLVVTMSQ